MIYQSKTYSLNISKRAIANMVMQFRRRCYPVKSKYIIHFLNNRNKFDLLMHHSYSTFSKEIEVDFPHPLISITAHSFLPTGSQCTHAAFASHVLLTVV